jgi:hypothetical protein
MACLIAPASNLGIGKSSFIVTSGFPERFKSGEIAFSIC